MNYITRGVPKLKPPESVSVCLTPGFKYCCLAVTRDGNCQCLLISKKVAAELIAKGFPYEG